MKHLLLTTIAALVLVEVFFKGYYLQLIEVSRIR